MFIIIVREIRLIKPFSYSFIVLSLLNDISFYIFYVCIFKKKSHNKIFWPYNIFLFLKTKIITQCVECIFKCPWKLGAYQLVYHKCLSNEISK